uniref:probable calcium-binding protein CML46 n=1 Tax=Erigeron canadensis TaxID=72917 RepID=UPI001CB8DE36|nr:probable calcium-binding protein CML46 [Erigeron canadensis]
MTSMVAEFIQYLFSQVIQSMIVYHLIGFFFDHSKSQVEKKDIQERKLPKRLPSFKNESVRGYEVEMVMSSLGIFRNKNENFPKNLTSNDLFNIFEAEQPRLHEVKEAFDVFDENRDGFIDARELQKVLYALGLKERAGMDECKKMIRVFDDNDDGRIDFNEFVKFMEGTCC